MYRKLAIFRWLIAAIFVLMAATSLLPLPVNAAITYTLFENLTVDDTQSTIYGSNWAAQSFTCNTTAHSVVYIQLKLGKVGNPGNVTVSIRKAVAGLPTGLDIVAGTITEAELSTTTTLWVKMQPVSEEYIEASTQYAIVVRAPAGTSANYVLWRRTATSTYPYGTASTSSAGYIWTAQTYDHMFQIWGNSVLQIQDVKIFKSYSATDDWLIAVRYLNTYPPYYDDYDIKKYFTLQFLNASGNVTAQNSLPAWGNRIGSIYLSPSSVTSLTWGNTSYRIRIYGTFTGNPSTSYTFTAADWIGDNPTDLDSWVITSATSIGTYYNTANTIYIADRGEVLNASGGTIASAGISGLSVVRPNLFQIYTNKVPYDPKTITQSGRNAVAWQTNVGPDAVTELTRVGGMFGVTGDLVVTFIFAIMAIGLGIFGFQGSAASSTAAMVLSIPIIIVGSLFGVNWVFIAGLGLIAIFLLVKAIWINVGS